MKLNKKIKNVGAKFSYPISSIINGHLDKKVYYNIHNKIWFSVFREINFLIWDQINQDKFELV